MKYRPFGLIMLLGLMACEATDPLYDPYTNDLVGTWQLREVLSDPGDGSGTYTPVTSDKTIVFKADGTFEASQNMCTAGNSDDLTNVGTYEVDKSILIATNCHYGASEEALQLEFKLEGLSLYISFPCIEPCGEKYVKIK